MIDFYQYGEGLPTSVSTAEVEGLSSGTSYDWALAAEQERQRQVALRAELEQLRVREKALRRLRAAAASQGVQAALPRIADVGQDASSAELGVVVTAARAGLDALEQRLTSALAERASERTARWTAALADDVVAPLAVSAVEAVAAARAAERADRVTRAAAAAADLLTAEGDRCADADLPGLVRLSERIGQLQPAQARIALQDLEVRVAESIRRRQRIEHAEQLRARLMYLTGEAGAEERGELRRRVASAPDDALPDLAAVLDRAVEAESRRRARSEVTERLVQALQHRGYVIGETFDDALAPGGRVTIMPSAQAPEYGLRLTIDAERERLLATVVRRDDLNGGDDLSAQQQICRDLAEIEGHLAGDGVTLRVAWRRDPNGQAPTMPARHWAALDHATGRSGEAERDAEAEQARLRAAHARAQQQPRVRAKDGRT